MDCTKPKAALRALLHTIIIAILVAVFLTLTNDARPTIAILGSLAFFGVMLLPALISTYCARIDARRHQAKINALSDEEYEEWLRRHPRRRRSHDDNPLPIAQWLAMRDVGEGPWRNV